MFLSIIIIIAIFALLLKAYILFATARYKITKNLKGKVVVITGGTAGIGKETVREVARHGATVHVLARDMSKAERVLVAIRAETKNQEIHCHSVNLSDFSTVRTFAKEFLATKSPIHILINNAGTSAKSRQTTVDGCEEVCQANHLSHFLLTNLLLDRITESSPSRIINVTSAAHLYVDLPGQGGKAPFDPYDMNFEKTFSGKVFILYMWSKLENIYFTRELARRLRGKGITVNCVHPGVVRTAIFANVNLMSLMGLFTVLGWPFFKTANEGAQTTLFLAAADEVSNITGEYFVGCKPAAISLLAADCKMAERVWHESERLTGIVRS